MCSKPDHLPSKGKRLHDPSSHRKESEAKLRVKTIAQRPKVTAGWREQIYDGDRVDGDWALTEDVANAEVVLLGPDSIIDARVPSLVVADGVDFRSSSVYEQAVDREDEEEAGVSAEPRNIVLHWVIGMGRGSRWSFQLNERSVSGQLDFGLI